MGFVRKFNTNTSVDGQQYFLPHDAIRSMIPSIPSPRQKSRYVYLTCVT